MFNQASGYNMKVVMQETRLNAETLRAWERRYGVPKPERTPGGHRLYTGRDIQMLKWLTARQEEGMSISRAIDNWRKLEASGQDPLLTYLPQLQQIESGGSAIGDLCRAWVNACLDFNEQLAEQILTQAFGLFPPEIVCVDLIHKGISIIGDDWFTGKTSVQQEHFASSLAMRRIYSLFAASPAPTRPGRILACCPVGEQHELGLLMLVVMLRRRGWDVIYLGANVPIMRLDSTLQVIDPFLVVSVALTLPSVASLSNMGEFLTSRGLRLAYAGGLFDSQPSLQKNIPGFYLGRTYSEAIQTVEYLWNLKPLSPTFNFLPPGYQQALQNFRDLHYQIEIFLTERLQSAEILPAHLDIVLLNLRQHLEAALELGDIDLVENSVDWVERLLLNHGVPRESLNRFFDEYRIALETYLPEPDQIIYSHLIGYFKDYFGKSPKSKVYDALESR